METEEMCLTASKCLALDLFKEGLRQMSLGGIMQTMAMAHPVYKHDKHRSFRFLAFTAMIWKGSTAGIDAVRANATCRVCSENNRWLSGEITIKAIDQTRTFLGEIHQDTGQLVLTESPSA